MHYGKNNIKTYYNFDNTKSDSHGVVAVDQEKFNFIWLNYPNLEAIGLSAVPQDVVDGVCKYMDRKTRSMLKKRPLDFMQYWDSVDNERVHQGLGLGLTHALPDGYRVTMWEQAREAQSRVCRMIGGNVVQFSFA